ncbi:UNVERIFIED_ORG: hypothetical protein J2W85_004887 [Ensifer adhaerens]|nr:hypothetical protein [Ensifer adhaerens]
MRNFTHEITTLLGASVNALVFGNRRASGSRR